MSKKHEELDSFIQEKFAIQSQNLIINFVSDAETLARKILDDFGKLTKTNGIYDLIVNKYPNCQSIAMAKKQGLLHK
jgi:hypothetical protein